MIKQKTDYKWTMENIKQISNYIKEKKEKKSNIKKQKCL